MMKTIPTFKSHNNLLPADSAVASILQKQGCTAADWTNVKIHIHTDLSLIRNVRFKGCVEIGTLRSDSTRQEGIFNAVINNCHIADGCYISNVGGELRNCKIGANTTIENVGRIEFEEEAACGIGTAVAVLDETGSRPVYIYPGLDAQMAALMAWNPHWTEEHLLPLLQEEWEQKEPIAFIGRDVKIRDCKQIINVAVGNGVTIDGAARLVNGTIINNADAGHTFTYVGMNVDAENFIIEDGHVGSGVLMRNCYVGQGAVIDKNFTAHDSLFFANAACENGEACAIIAGPYTVTMHKSSLLIGGAYSFMNAGSGTNSSNHKYKLGPVHWGVMERGVKTASDSYVMWGGRIGAFSMLMGAHKQHPDTSAFPFSYLFAAPDGGTIVTPGVMLRSCGLMRDELKWPNRDNRLKHKLPIHDRITFAVLNPITVGTMIHSLATIDEILLTPKQADGYLHFNGLRFKESSLRHGKELYELAILKYFHECLSTEELHENNQAHPWAFEPSEPGKHNAAEAQSPLQGATATQDAKANIGEQASPEGEATGHTFSSSVPHPPTPQISSDSADWQWIDLGGLIMLRSDINAILHADSLKEMRAKLNEAFALYKDNERKWIATILAEGWQNRLPEAAQAKAKLTALIDNDRHRYLSTLSKQNSSFLK